MAGPFSRSSPKADPAIKMSQDLYKIAYRYINLSIFSSFVVNFMAAISLSTFWLSYFSTE
jgi:hypothetical protein